MPEHGRGREPGVGAFLAHYAAIVAVVLAGVGIVAVIAYYLMETA